MAVVTIKLLFMRKNILPRCFLLFTFPVLVSHSQSDRFGYAVTDVNKEGANWSFLRKIDLTNGTFSDVILDGNDAKALAFDDATKKQLTEPLKDARFGNLANAAFGTGVAAIALDKKNSRLYFTPMFVYQLRYIDLKTMRVYFVNTPQNDALGKKSSDQSNVITRMAIGDDGYGYALTNDGNHLLRFTTGKKVSITDLGVIVDDPANKLVSVHNSCTSFGGDMIADDDGNLFLISNKTNVFKINIETKVATHLGTVSGLPTPYTINGAAVDDNNQILVSSAINHNNMYTIDSKTWAAVPTKAAGGWRTSDLATSNLLSTRKVQPPIDLLKSISEKDDGRVQLYPNPVVNDQFSIQFNLPAGNYTTQIKDLTGRQVFQTTINVLGKGQVKTLNMPSASSKGFYLVKVIDQNNKTVYLKKVLVH